MTNSRGNLKILLNGEIYNYLELRRTLEGEFQFRTQSDTEVLLAAYSKWGSEMLSRLIGMFVIVIWDEDTDTGFIARDRFGVKPLYYHQKSDGTLFFASEIKALHAAGIPREANPVTWSNYLVYGVADGSEETFWKGVISLPAGHSIKWHEGRVEFNRWYDLCNKTDLDRREESEVSEEYLELLLDSVRLRFRSDVPVGINLSGGLDSSTLLGVVEAIGKGDESVTAYTFVTGDERYDELPWVRQMIEKTKHPLTVSTLKASEVPELAASVQYHQDEPFGGIPTLAYAKIFADARANGTVVLLDGNGMDEQWAGYDYYRQAGNGSPAGVVQGTADSPVRPDCTLPEFRSLAREPEFPQRFGDKLLDLQYRDAFCTKIPRAMRYNDRISMRSSTELREPFLDHRLFELAFRQPAERKIGENVTKKMLRQIVRKIVPDGISEAPKRPLQTPQREWLRGELRDWAACRIEAGLDAVGGQWLDRRAVAEEWRRYCDGASDNSFYVWQWISLGLMAENLN